MTVITVHHPVGRIDFEQRRTLAMSLTDAVLEVECGQIIEVARIGFQVHFRPLERDEIAIGGLLLADQGDDADAMVVDIAVMEAAWAPADRARVIEAVGSALAAALGTDAPSPSWWVLFRTIDEGSWGAGGSVVPIVDLVDLGVFSAARADAIREAVRGER